ncbi:hypothetical protein [Flavobacterium sp. T12S277]|uniref:hypothetical protein n=1 Tax=Flavobacterium sp. T12S277 TaxID=3402752 RepID=UPI003AEE8348
MRINESWDKNITLLSLDGKTTDPNELQVVWASFSFYDCEYTAAVSKKDIEKDTPNVALEGDSILFDSFNSLIEDACWEKLKMCFERYQTYLIQLDNEEY